MSQYTNHLFSLLIVTFLVIGTQVQASHVPMEKAKEIARVTYAMKSNLAIRSSQEVQVVEEYTQMTEDVPAYYIFNMAPKGFVVVSAESNYNAVLAFSDESQFMINDPSTNWAAMATLGEHERRIAYNRAHDIKPTPSIAREWETLNHSTVNEYIGKSNPEGVVVPPLTTTIWDQGEFYNGFTPRDADPTSIAGGAYCGCAPIAMAQLIKYHNYPASGHGSNAYVDPVYGDISADFCRPYNWDNMPDSLTAPNNDVAEFIYHVGAATNSEFSITYTATFISFMRDALVEFFNYDEAADWFFDFNNDFARVAINDLNQGRPLMLSGEAYNGNVFAGAHTWVADGYGFFLEPIGDQPDEYFHFNWGWGGDNNGWFLDTQNAAWNPIPGTFGNDQITFWWQRYVIHNIFPAENNCGAPKTLYTSQITPRSVYLNTDYVTEYTNVYNFRIREVGTTEWRETNPSSNYYGFVPGLEADTEYEYQVRKQCCSGDWSDYGELLSFRSAPAVMANPCSSLRESSLSATTITENSATINTSRPYGTVNNQFRYRFVGSFLWTFSTVNTGHARFLNNLEPGTEYEYQVRHACSDTEWSEFGSSSFFSTEGGVGNCELGTDVDLFTSSTTETYSYIYTSQPLGRTDNEFRYRPTGSNDWTLTDVSSLYYRFISNLEPATEYEFQVRHNCGPSQWSEWSFSHTFNTAGGAVCDDIDGGRLYFNSVTASNAYIYTPQPFGQVANEFRYKSTTSSDWIQSDVSILYYRYLSNLSAGTEYEFQVRHECTVGSFTDWSVSQRFTTNPGVGGGGISQRAVLLPPKESPAFSDDLLLVNSMSIYPNPSDVNLNIEFGFPIVSQAQGNILDFSGRVLEQFSVAEDSQTMRLDVSELSAGVYLLSVNSINQTMIQKVIIH